MVRDVNSEWLRRKQLWITFSVILAFTLCIRQKPVKYSTAGGIYPNITFHFNPPRQHLNPYWLYTASQPSEDVLGILALAFI
jgi:hypothetical protein